MSERLLLLRGLLFPPRCVGCNKRLPPPIAGDAPALCRDCATRFEKEVRTECPRCFSPYCECHCCPSVMERAGCVDFVKLSPYREGDEGNVTRRLVLEMKRGPRRRAFAFAASELRCAIEEALQRAGCTKQRAVITYLPRDPRTVRRTGVDQAEVLALALSHQTGIDFATFLQRTGRGKPQKSLSAAARAQNLREAFRVVKNPTGDCVLLVDDIVTTGAGMSVATKLLRRAGAANVIAVSLAYTERKKQSR